MASALLADAPPAAGSLDPVPLKAWNVADSGHDKSQLQSGFTLRVKPDRRGVQLPIPGGRDRRRPR